MVRKLLMAAVLVAPAFAWSQSGAPGAHGDLPQGNGRDIAAAKCLDCHDASRLATPGHRRAGWQDVISRMMNMGIPAYNLASTLTLIIAQRQALSTAEMRATAAESEAQYRALLIEKLKFTIRKLKHDRFGQSSERGALLDQLELQLADLEELLP